MSLTNKQRVFVDEYLQCWNATEAALRAGYSKKTAYSIGWENLRKPEISNLIEKRLQENAMSAEEVLSRLAQIGRADIAEFMDIFGTGYNLDLMKAKEAGLTHLIKKVKQKTTTFIAKKESDEDREVTELELELHDAKDALKTLAQYHGLTTTNKQEHSGEIEIVVRYADE